MKMEKILFINGCVRPGSRTLELARYVLENLSGEITEVKLYDEELLPLSLKELEIRECAAKSKDFSHSVFSLAKQFAKADIILIGVPYWDLMFPAVLKNYLEKITVNGLTFAYSKEGIPFGLCNAKKLIYVTTSGGPIKYNFGYEYVSALAKSFYGINDTLCVKAECLDIHGADIAAIMEKAKKSYIN